MERSINLSDLFEEGFALGRKDKTALFMHSGNGLSTTLTYADVSELSNVVASVLRDFNCSRKFISVISSTSIHIPAIILGILKVPACFVPVDYQANIVLNEFIFSKLKIEHVICMKRDGQQFIEKLGKQLKFCCLDTPALLPYQLVVLKHTSQESDRKEQEQDNAGIAYAIHTSGTTGRPKVVRVPHKCIVPNIISLRTKLKVTNDDVVFMASPLTFDPCIVEMFLALSTGAALFMVPMTTKLMPKKLAQALQDNKVTILQATSSLVSRFGPTLLKNTILSRDTKLRALVLGGEQCPVPAVLSDWRAEGNVTTMWNIYGITEVSSWATLYQIPEQDIKNAMNQSVPIGEPMLGTVIQVKDDRGQAITSGKGHLYIGGEERVCLLDNEDVLEPGTMRASGDIVQFTSQGLVYVGRMDQQIKRHGQGINLQQLTEIISSVPIFNSCCLLHETETDELLLFAVPKLSLTQQMIYKELENTLPKNCIPDQVCLLNELPVTKHGKVDARKLLERRKVAKLGRIDGCLSNEELHNLWKDILQIDGKIEDNSNFIQLGGDSFQAVRLLNQIELVIGRSIPDLLDFILHRTYHEVFELVKNKSSVTSKHGHEFESIPSVEQSSTSVPCGLLQNDVLTNKQFTEMTSQHCTMEFDKVSQQILLHGNMDHQRKRTLGLINNVGSSSTKKSKKDIADTDTFQMNVNRESLDCSIKKEAVKSATVYHSIRRGSQITHHEKQNILMKNVSRGQQAIIVEKWKCDTGKCIDASPLLVTTDGVNAVVYIGSHSHKFLAVSFKTGVPIWITTLGDRVESSACLSKCGSYIAVGCYDHNVYILNAQNGEIFWFWKTSGPVKSSPIIHPHTGIVYVGSHDQNIYALDIKNKQCLFSTHCGGGSVFSSPCIDVTMGIIYVGTLSGILTCINLVSGEKKWMHRIGKPVFSSPAVTMEGVIVGCVDNYLYHISSLNEMIWSFKTDAPIFSSPCLSSTNDLTVFGSHDSCIYCIHCSTGKQVWKFKTPSPVYATPFIFYNDLFQSAERNGEYFVVCCCTEGSLYILNLLTGSLVLSWVAKGEIFSSPIVYNNDIFVGCRDDYIYNLQLVAKT